MKKVLFLLITLSILTVRTYSQIHSTAIGGLWNDPNTWVGGAIPGSGDDVIIEGPVIHGSASGYTILTEYCKNLTITSNGSLKNAEYGGGSGIFPLVVSGNVVNNGIVSDGTSDFIKIFISGDLENNNIWMPYETEFQTANNHNLSLAPGKSFGSRLRNNGSPSFTALTDMLFTCDYSVDGNLYRDHFYLNGQTFNIGNHSIELRQCLINKGTLTGDFEILGNFTTGWTEGYDIKDTLLFVGNVTVTDTLTGNIYGGGYGIYKLKVIGNLINNGVIKDDYDTGGRPKISYDVNSVLNPDDLELLITGNIINNGIWECNFTTLIGNGTQTIYQSDGKMFDGYLTYLGSANELNAQSNITITKDFGLNNVTLQMNNHTLNVHRWLTNGKINNCVLYNGYLQNINSLNNLIITGTVTVDNNNVFHGSVILQDTLQSNEYGGGSTVFTLPIIGDITNYGVIKNINDGDMLSLEVYGNIYNEGKWENSFTKFTGTSTHHITSLKNKVLSGDFSILDSSGTVVADNDLIFSGNINLGRAEIDMQNHEISLNNNRWISNGYIKNAKIKNGMLSHLRLLDQIEINGRVEIENNVDAIANIIVNDTLSTIAYGGGTGAFYFTVYGNIENSGLFGQIYDDVLRLYINGDIVNKGIWNTDQNNLMFFKNNTNCSLSCINTSSTNMQVNGSVITGSGAPAYSIISGGGIQTISPNQSYDLSLQFTPTSGDTTATLNIDCTEIGSLNNIHLIGYNYNTTVDIKEEKSPVLPNEFVLNQNYPNPFNPSTKISWQSPVGSWQTLKVFDVLGNEVATLVNEYKPAGSYEVEFSTLGGSASGRNVAHESLRASGVYFYQLKAGDFIQTKKMLMIK